VVCRWMKGEGSLSGVQVDEGESPLAAIAVCCGVQVDEGRGVP
jgi:hypothetical protein